MSSVVATHISSKKKYK